MGSEPNVMAETSDGNYLFVGLSGANSLAQFDLVEPDVNRDDPAQLSAKQLDHYECRRQLAGDDAGKRHDPCGRNRLYLGVTLGSWTYPGTPARSGRIFPGSTRGPTRSSRTQPIFMRYDSQTSGSEFYRYTVNASGLTLVDGTTLDGMSGYFGGIALADGLVYGEGGGVANPTATPPSQVATLPLLNFSGSDVGGDGIGVVPDPSLQKDFLMVNEFSGAISNALTRYDLKTFLPEAAVGIPGSSPNSYQAWPMLRFGQDGLALLSSSQDPTTYQYVTTLILLRGPFVTPQLLSTNTAATLTSSSSSSMTHGSGNAVLTLTGTNFLPGIAITWNGSYRTTTLLSSTQATVDIPANDVASIGTASLLATNPGAPASNALQITIN